MCLRLCEAPALDTALRLYSDGAERLERKWGLGTSEVRARCREAATRSVTMGFFHGLESDWEGHGRDVVVGWIIDCVRHTASNKRNQKP